MQGNGPVGRVTKSGEEPPSQGDVDSNGDLAAELAAYAAAAGRVARVRTGVGPYVAADLDPGEQVGLVLGLIIAGETKGAS